MESTKTEVSRLSYEKQLEVLREIVRNIITNEQLFRLYLQDERLQQMVKDIT